jgi:hypothetical protein
MNGRTAFVHRYLDPSESLLEILFGLIMAFTITAGARLLSAPHELVVGELAIAVLGCNLAWGIIDGGFYLLGTIFNRNRRISFVRRLQGAANEAEAMKLVREEFEFELEDEQAISPDDQADLYAHLLNRFRRAKTARAHLHRRDYVAALLIVMLVTATAIPGLIFLAVVRDPMHALRMANIAQIGLLFAVGYGWASFTAAAPWLAGVIITILGLLLTVIAVALGG